MKHKLKSLVKLMKVLIKNFNMGFRKIAHVDREYFARQHAVTETYKLLVHHYSLLNARRYVIKRMKRREKASHISHPDASAHHSDIVYLTFSAAAAHHSLQSLPGHKNLLAPPIRDIKRSESSLADLEEELPPFEPSEAPAIVLTKDQAAFNH